MHASTEQLLARLDGEPLDAETVRRIDESRECREAMAKIAANREALRNLPELKAPAGGFAAVVAALPAGSDRRPLWLAAAAAAVAIVAVALVGLQQAPNTTRPAESIAVETPVTGAPAQPDDQWRALASRSELMERELRRLRSAAPSIVRVGHARDRALVESRLRAIDYGLSRVAGDTALRDTYWNERVRLLDSMMVMERAELIRTEHAGYRVVPVSNNR